MITQHAQQQHQATARKIAMEVVNVVDGRTHENNLLINQQY